MNEKESYEKQYGKKKLVNLPQKKYWGLRRLLGKYDWDRYAIAEQIIHPGKKILDIGYAEVASWLNSEIGDQHFCVVILSLRQ